MTSGKKSLLGFMILFISTSITAESISLSDFIRPNEYFDFALSPDGTYLAMIVNSGDPKRPYKKALKVLNIKKMQWGASITFPQAYSVESVTWANDERMLIYGAEKWSKYSTAVWNPNLVAINWDGSKQQTIFGPEAGKADFSHAVPTKSNAGMSEYASFSFIRELPNEPEFVLGYKYPWSNGKDEDEYTSLIKLNVYNGSQKTIEKIPLKGASVVVDHDNEARFAIVETRKLENEIYYRAKGGKIFEKVESFISSNGGWIPQGFMSDGKHVLISSDKDRKLTAIYKMNPDTQEKSLVFEDSAGDVDSIWWSEDKRSAYAGKTHTGIPRQFILDHSAGESAVLTEAMRAFPGKMISLRSATRDGKTAIIGVYSDTDIAAYYLVDLNHSKVIEIGSSRPWLAGKQLAKMMPTSISARDGLQLPSILTKPNGRESRKNPLVLLVHGGPYGVYDEVGYDQEVQILAANGFAVLQVNFRGSGGYGRDFQYQAYGQWGATMQNDLVDAVDWAVKNGIAEQDKICIMGHSYGGYAAAWASVRDPSLFRCAIASMGVYDLKLMYEEGDIQERERGLAYLKQAIGESEEQLRLRSPVNFAKYLQIPLLLSHGEEDRRVPIEHAIRFKKALDNAGKKYEWIEFDDETHGFGSEQNEKKFYSSVLNFLNANIN